MRVHDTQAYRRTDVTRARTSYTSELREIHLSFESGFNLVNAAVVCAILESDHGVKTPLKKPRRGLKYPLEREKIKSPVK